MEMVSFQHGSKEGSEPLARTYVALLRKQMELPCIHILDHAVAKSAEGIGTHGKLLSEVDNTSISRQGFRFVTDRDRG